MTILDRAIGYLAPQVTLRRARQRPRRVRPPNSVTSLGPTPGTESRILVVPKIDLRPLSH